VHPAVDLFSSRARSWVARRTRETKARSSRTGHKRSSMLAARPLVLAVTIKLIVQIVHPIYPDEKDQLFALGYDPRS